MKADGPETDFRSAPPALYGLGILGTFSFFIFTFEIVLLELLSVVRQTRSSYP